MTNKVDNIQKSLIDFAGSIVQLTARLPKTTAGQHFSQEILETSTNPALVYRDARDAHSIHDFVNLLEKILNCLNKTLILLEIMRTGRLVTKQDHDQFASECNELCRMIQTSIKVSMSKQGKGKHLC